MPLASEAREIAAPPSRQARNVPRYHLLGDGQDARLVLDDEADHVPRPPRRLGAVQPLGIVGHLDGRMQ